MPINASSAHTLMGYLVGTSGATGIPGLISHIQASSAAFAASDINVMSDQLMGIYNYINVSIGELQHGLLKSS
jgi:hypothetical protein